MANTKKEENKEEDIYLEFEFYNLQDQGNNLDFTYGNHYYNFVPGKICLAKKEVVEWVRSLTYPKPVVQKDANGKKYTRVEKHPRFMLNVIKEHVGKPKAA